MERSFNCPSCGAANVVTNPGVLMKVCDYCRTFIYWDKDSALRAGRKSMDLPDSPRFEVGATGKIKGQSFMVLGRLAYAHEKGMWSEWFVELQDGRILWLSEDEGEVFIEERLELTSPVPPFEDLAPGMQITLNERTGVIEELGEARCIGGEGQIPFEVEIGEVYGYADGAGSDGSFIFGLEYDSESGRPTAFIGKALKLKDTESHAKGGYVPEAKAGDIIRCASCGKPYEGKTVESTESVACQACGAILELDEAETRVVGQNQGEMPLFTFDVGASITLEGVSYEVMGRLYYVEREDLEIYTSREYILYHAEKGYLWLSEENGHFTVSWPIHLQIKLRGFSQPKQQVRVAQDIFRTYEQGSVTLQWVDGALPWTASVGETTQYTTLVKPPEYIDREVTGTELELFKGRYVSRSEIEAGVSKDVQLPYGRGVYSCQPYVPPSWLKGLGIVGIFFVILNIALFVYSLAADKGNVILTQRIIAKDYTKEVLTAPFEVTEPNAILRLTGRAPLRNSWLALDFALVDSKDRVLGEFWNEASFYEGRDSEGYWSEGSRGFKQYIKVEEPGTYRLLVHGKGGSGYNNPGLNEPIDLRLEAHATVSWYFVFPIVLAAIIAILGAAFRWSFELRRWAPVMETDDD